jgi:hypothetical protein
VETGPIAVGPLSEREKDPATWRLSQDVVAFVVAVASRGASLGHGGGVDD